MRARAEGEAGAEASEDGALGLPAAAPLSVLDLSSNGLRAVRGADECSRLQVAYILSIFIIISF